jgi:oligopeptide/dipeptide ABC transporter ATP-binding protein
MLGKGRQSTLVLSTFALMAGLDHGLHGGEDEPVSALDVSIQAQILNLMRDLQHEHGLTYLFISHDLSVARYMADAIGVMYLGKLVETGPADAVYAAPAHPYTKGLIDTVPVADPAAKRAKEHQGVVGELPSAIAPPNRRCVPSPVPPTKPPAISRAASRSRAWCRRPNRLRPDQRTRPRRVLPSGPVPTDGHSSTKTAFVSGAAPFGRRLTLADCPAWSPRSSSPTGAR